MKVDINGLVGLARILLVRLRSPWCKKASRLSEFPFLDIKQETCLSCVPHSGGQAEIRALFLYRAHHHYSIFTRWHYEQGIFTYGAASLACRPGLQNQDGWYHAAWRATDI
jgi:hypothetical protein